MCPGATYDASDETITHQLVDRPKLNDMVVNRYVSVYDRSVVSCFFRYFRVYIQPQWVFDSINARQLLPADKYLPGDYCC